MRKISQAAQVRDGWLDPALAAVALAAFEIEIAPAARWPTLAMRERVALCDGELEADEWRLRVRLPRAFEEVLA